MTIVDDAFVGLVMTSTALSHDLPVDFLFAADGFALVGVAGWWQQDWGGDQGVLQLAGKLEKDTYGWKLVREDGVATHFTKPERRGDRLCCASNRDATDCDRAAYLAEIDKLAKAAGDLWSVDIVSWRGAVVLRAERSAAEMLSARMTGERPVGIVVMLDQDGEKVDALVIDELGSAATARETPWLESIGSQWLSYGDRDRPDLHEFMAWVAEQVPYGTYALDRPKVGTDKGTTEAIALRSLPTRV